MVHDPKSKVALNSIKENEKTLLSSPLEGLWSIATGWENGWPSNWPHAQISSVKNIGEWKEVKGKLVLPEGEWLLKDYYKKEGSKINGVYGMSNQIERNNTGTRNPTSIIKCHQSDAKLHATQNIVLNAEQFYNLEIKPRIENELKTNIT